MLLLVVITESGRWGGEGLFGGGFVVIVFVEVDDDKSSSNDLDFDIPVAALLIGTGLLIDGDGFLCELLLVLLLFEGYCGFMGLGLVGGVDGFFKLCLEKLFDIDDSSKDDERFDDVFS